MIIYKTWKQRLKKDFLDTYSWDGWFLFGIIPLYIRRKTLIK